MAFNTPCKMFKRHTWEGGVADPMDRALAGRHQGQGRDPRPVHALLDIVPMVYECLGIEPPEAVKGYTQWDLEGTSFQLHLRRRRRRDPKPSQFYVDARLPARSGATAGRPRHCTPAPRRTGATSPRTRGRSTTSRKTARSATTWPRSTPKLLTSSSRSGTARPASTSAPSRSKTAPRSRCSPPRGRR